MPFLIIGLVIVIIVLYLRLKEAESKTTELNANKSVEEKTAGIIVASIKISIDLLKRKIPLQSSVISDAVLFAAYHRILSDVLTAYNLQDHFKSAYIVSLSRFSSGDKMQQEVACQIFEKCRTDFAECIIKSFDDFEGFCASAFFLAHDYYDFDDYYDRAEKIYMDEIYKTVSSAIKRLDSVYPEKKATNPIPKKEEAYFLLEAANGMMVNVPESKLESWQKAQDEIRNGTYKVDEAEIQQMMDFLDRKAKEAKGTENNPQ